MAVLSSAFYILLGVIALSILVLVHELGHFLVGRALGFKILEFSIGFGPRFARFGKKGIDYSFRAIPLGGYVKFYGEDEEKNEPGAMNEMPWYKRLASLSAGSIANLIFAILLGIILFMTYGDFVSRIDTVATGAPAQIAGLKSGDTIVAVNGKKMFFWDTSSQIAAAPNDSFTITVRRDGKILEPITLHKIKETVDGQTVYRIGITMAANATERLGLGDAATRSCMYLGEVTRQVFDFLGKLFTLHINPKDAAGPVTTIVEVGQASRLGFNWLLFLMMLLSINLGIFNLLPFPALDGGRLALLAVEVVRGKAMDRNKEAMIHFIGFVLLIGLVVFIELAHWITK